MVDLQKTHEQFLKWTRSRDFVAHVERMVSKPALWPLVVGILFTASVIGIPIGLLFLRRASRERRAFRTIIKNAPEHYAHWRPVLCGIAIANREALQSANGFAPALLVGAFGQCTPELVQAIAHSASKLGDLYGKEPAKIAPELRLPCELVNDDEYKRGRRRPVPRSISGEQSLILFDAILDRAMWKKGNPEIPLVVCMAEHKMGGDIIQVPDHVIAWTESLSGAPIIRHSEPPKEEPPIVFDSKYGSEVEAHIERHLGEVKTVFHELVSTTVHVDIHIIPPGPNRKWITLVTSGMSDVAMKTPVGAEHLAHAELMLRLPPTWPMSQEDFKDEANYWPVRWLKMLVRFPHTLNTWLSAGHTIPNGDPAEPLHPSLSLIGWALSRPFVGGEGFEVLEASDGTPIHFFSIVPLHASEMQLKLDRGWEHLHSRLTAAGVSDLIDPHRPAVA